jgi:hypothetical protein
LVGDLRAAPDFGAVIFVLNEGINGAEEASTGLVFVVGCSPGVRLSGFSKPVASLINFFTDGVWDFLLKTAKSARDSAFKGLMPGG